MSRFSSLQEQRQTFGRFAKPVAKVEPRENKLFVYLTCLYIIVWYLQLGSRIEILGTIRFEFLLGAFLSVAAVITLINQQKKSTPLKPPIIFYFSILIFYTVFSYDHATSWDVFFNRVIKFSMVALFFSAFIQTTWSLKLAISAFLLAMLKLGQEGFVGWYWGGMVWENQGVMRLHGSTSLIGHPNSFSGMAVGCLPFIYFLYPVMDRFWKKGFLILLLIFCGIIIIFTASRTGYVATGLLIIYAIIKLKKKSRLRLIGFIFLTSLITAPFIPAQYIDRFSSIFTMQEAEGQSTSARLQIIEDALYIASTKPWGIGVGAFPTVRKNLFGRSQDTHNLYLELLTNLSIIGLVAFSYLIAKIIKTNIEIQRALRAHSSKNSEFITALSKATVGFVLARLFLGLFGMDTYEIYWWFAIGLTISLYESSHSKEWPSKTLPNIFRSRNHQIRLNRNP